jgi:hypothetical protein
MTDDQLNEGGHQPFFVSRPFTVRQYLGVICNEEWHHHRYAVRDLDAIVARDSGPQG